MRSARGDRMKSSVNKPGNGHGTDQPDVTPGHPGERRSPSFRNRRLRRPEDREGRGGHDHRESPDGQQHAQPEKPGWGAWEEQSAPGTVEKRGKGYKKEGEQCGVRESPAPDMPRLLPQGRLRRTSARSGLASHLAPSPRQEQTHAYGEEPGFAMRLKEGLPIRVAQDKRPKDRALGIPVRCLPDEQSHPSRSEEKGESRERNQHGREGGGDVRNRDANRHQK